MNNEQKQSKEFLKNGRGNIQAHKRTKNVMYLSLLILSFLLVYHDSLPVKADTVMSTVGTATVNVSQVQQVTMEKRRLDSYVTSVRGLDPNVVRSYVKEIQSATSLTELNAIEMAIQNDVAAIPYEQYDQQASDRLNDLVNQERVSQGFTAFKVDKSHRDMQEGARIRAREISQRPTHQRPDGSKFYTAIPTTDGNHYTYFSEAVYRGPAPFVHEETAAIAFKAWMNSEGHRRILMKDRSDLYMTTAFYTDSATGRMHAVLMTYKVK
ncbi:CAP domain-containing protein [Vagococcus lutrae]|uniref:CAP domain-containing protein n=1 Tax=Vagococcus lutrae TaxID=81947 RepID=UPI000F861898|nr:CAP domain-containing protein [Vagococcus lutrae]MDY3706492.1 hypothetical protein [Vagococcus lutrae]RST91515.1 hypothetical protein CBF33_07280 [Vagococcus lutrae]UQF22658.1 hypothetical protein M2909_05790 [Vagococcus lutrae]UQF63423.1 hypothetical protein M2908_05925 [Vagococcus lutrae]